MTIHARLCKDDFIALRSLARGRWVQGREIAWKVNRSWLCIPFFGAAIDAAYRLEKMGLVENFVCCKTCGEVFQLTEAGRARASQIDRGSVAKVPDVAPRSKVERVQPGKWFQRLTEVFTAHTKKLQQ